MLSVSAANGLSFIAVRSLNLCMCDCEKSTAWSCATRKETVGKWWFTDVHSSVSWRVMKMIRDSGILSQCPNWIESNRIWLWNENLIKFASCATLVDNMKSTWVEKSRSTNCYISENFWKFLKRGFKVVWKLYESNRNKSSWLYVLNVEIFLKNNDSTISFNIA